MIPPAINAASVSFIEMNQVQRVNRSGSGHGWRWAYPTIIAGPKWDDGRLVRVLKLADQDAASAHR